MSDETGDKDKHAHKCDLCNLSYQTEKDLREHFWSLMHHVNIEQKKKNTLHNCTLCFTACASLSEYRKHLNGEKHKKTLEQCRNAEEEKAPETESQKPSRKQKLRGPPSEKGVEETSHQSNDNEGNVEPETDMGGYTRDPVFYKRRSNRAQQDNQEHQPTDNYNRRSRWDNSEPYWDQGYDHGGPGPFHRQIYGNDYYQNDFPIGWGRPEFPNTFGYGWHPRGRGGPGGFHGPPQGPPGGYLDFSDVRREGEEDWEGEGGEEEEPWRNQKWGRGWNKYDSSSNSWRNGNNSRRNSFEKPEMDNGKETWKEGWKKSKKKKKKWKSGSGAMGNNSSVNSDSPDNPNGRKRGRGFELDSLSSKSSRLTINVTEGNDHRSVSQEKDTDTLSSSVRSTSSSHSKSSNKSRSNSNSPSIRLKSLGTRKLKTARNSPKGFRVPAKLKQASRKLRSEIENDDINSESSGVLEKAEKLCKELREKRERAKLDQEKVMKSKKNQHRDTLNRQIQILADANKSRIKGHLVTAEKHQGASSSEVSGRESGIATFTSSQTSDFSASGSSFSSSRTPTQSSSTPVFRSDIDRIRHNIESSVRRTASSPVRASTAGESPSEIPKSKRPLSKDSLLKMVNSPRSRNERMQLARMLRSHTKSMNKLAPSRLNVQMNGLYDDCEFEDLDIPAISLEDLSPEVKLQIAQLIEDEVNVDGEVPTSPLTSLRGPTSKAPNFQRSETTKRPRFRFESKMEAATDDALFLDDLTSPEPMVRSGRTSVDINSSDKEQEQPLVTVTSVNGVPQLQVSEPTVVAHLQVSEETVTSNTQPHSVFSPVISVCGGTREDDRSSVVSTAVDLGRRALEMSCLVDRQSPVQCSTSLTDMAASVESTSDMSAVVALSLKEEEKHRELEELDQKMEMMRKMLKRTLEHLDKSEQRRKKLMSDTKMIREHRLKILKEITGHPSLTAVQQTIEPSSSAPNNSSPSITVQSESMDLDPTTDSVSSTSQARPVGIRTELSSPGPQADDNLDHPTRQQTKDMTSQSQQRPSKPGNVSVGTVQRDFLSPDHPSFSKYPASVAITGNRQSDTGDRQSNATSKEAVSTPNHSNLGSSSMNKTPSSVMFMGPSESVTSLQVFNKHLYVSYTGQDIRRFHLQTGKLDLVYNCSYHSVQCMAVVSTPGREDCIFAGGLSFHLILFNVKSPQIVNTFELSEEIKCMHYDSGFVYVGLVSGSVEVFDVKNQRHKDSFQCAYQAIHCISSAREGGSRLICVSAQDTTISVCDARSGLPVRILEGHTKTSFSVMPSDHFVFSGSGDRTVMMHNLHTGKLEWTFKQHGGIVTSVWVEGNYLYSAGYDRIVRCFDIKNHTLKRMFYGAGKDVIMRMAVYGNKLYTGNREGQVESLDMGSESWPCQTCNCQFVFGLREHLLHHLLTDHANSSSKIIRCTWKDCSDWLTLTRDDGSVESHMRKHIESLEGKS